jgi:hypothetical protein
MPLVEEVEEVTVDEDAVDETGCLANLAVVVVVVVAEDEIAIGTTPSSMCELGMGRVRGIDEITCEVVLVVDSFGCDIPGPSC